jgi:uncharacterized Zn finger protein
LKRTGPASVKGRLPASWLADLGDTALRATAGEAVFKRGLSYAREGRVELVHDSGNRARFEADGTETYGVQLLLGPLGLEGGCDCPHAADGTFCKHQVAAAMVWRRALGVEADPDDAPGAPPPRPPTPERLAKAMQTRQANVRSLREFLNGRSAAELAERLWQRAEQDRGLMAELKAWAASAAAPDDPRALRAAVDALLKPGSRQAFERRHVREWAERAQQAVQLMQAALPGQAAEVRALVELAGRRWSAVYERAIDLSEPLDAVGAALNDTLEAALLAAPPPALWGERLLEWLQNDEWRLWQAERLLPALGEPARSVFSQRLTQAWKKADARVKPGRPMDSIDLGMQGTIVRTDPERDHLRAWMLIDLEQQGDLLAAFEFLRNSARGVTEHAGVIRWANQHGRQREALQIAQDAMKRFKGHPMIEDELLAIYERDGWDAEALAIRQRRFDAAPSVEAYGLLLHAARRAKADVAAVRRAAFEAAVRHEEHELAEARRWQRSIRGQEPLRDVGRRLGMLVADGELDAAVALVQPPHGAHPHTLQWLAERLPKARKADAFALLQRALDIEMAKAKSPYREALRLVAKGLGFAGQREGQAWLRGLAQQYAAKVTFVEALWPEGPV